MVSTNFGPGLHVAPGRAVDASAYDRWVGRWSRLFVPSVLAAAEVKAGYRVLDVSTGTGESALAAAARASDDRAINPFGRVAPF